MKRHMMARCCGLVLGGALLIAGPSPGWAIDEEVLLTTAEQACLAGQYQRGVEILANLYLATRKPAYLHNQARCYEQNGQNEAAIGRYNEFLRQVKNLPVEKKAEIEAHIIRLEQKVARQRITEGQAPYYGQQQPPGYVAPVQPPEANAGVQTYPQGGAYPGYQPPPAAAARAAEPSADVGVAASAPAGGGSKGLRIAGIASAAAGGAALVVGLVSGLSVKDAEKKTEDDIHASRSYDSKRWKSGEDSAKLATIGFIAAPVLVGAGALLYWLGMPSGDASKASVTVLPSVALGDGGGAGVNLSLRY